MTTEELPKNTMMLMVQVMRDGEISVLTGSNLDDDLDEEQLEYLNDVITGMFISFENMMNLYAFIGSMASNSEDMYNELNKKGIDFEPDEDLLKALKDNKIIPFDKKKLN